MAYADEALRLSPTDASWVQIERPDNPMVVNALMTLGGALSREDLLEVLRERLLAHPRFGSILRGRRLEPDRRVDVDRHLLEAPRDAGSGPEALRAWVGEVISRPLPWDRPAWQIWRLDRWDGRTVLLWRIHHALGDGVALLQVLLDVTDHAPESLPGHPHGDRAPGLLGRVLLLAKSGPATVRLVTRRHDDPTPLKGRLSGRKRVAWSQPFSLDEVKRIAHRLDATVNDVLVGAFSGALRAWLCARDVALPRALHAILPVDLRGGRDLDRLGNAFGLLFLQLPLHEATPKGRVCEAHARMQALKASPEPLIAFRLLQLTGRVVRRLAAFGVRLFARKASLFLTNVPGPTHSLCLAGRRMEDLMFWVPQPGAMGLGVSLLSYAGSVRIGIVSDEARVPEPAELVRRFEGELGALAASPA